MAEIKIGIVGPKSAGKTIFASVLQFVSSEQEKEDIESGYVSQFLKSLGLGKKNSKGVFWKIQGNNDEDTGNFIIEAATNLSDNRQFGQPTPIASEKTIRYRFNRDDEMMTVSFADVSGEWFSNPDATLESIQQISRDLDTKIDKANADAEKARADTDRTVNAADISNVEDKEKMLKALEAQKKNLITDIYDYLSDCDGIIFIADRLSKEKLSILLKYLTRLFAKLEKKEKIDQFYNIKMPIIFCFAKADTIFCSHPNTDILESLEQFYDLNDFSKKIPSAFHSFEKGHLDQISKYHGDEMIKFCFLSSIGYVRQGEKCFPNVMRGQDGKPRPIFKPSDVININVIQVFNKIFEMVKNVK